MLNLGLLGTDNSHGLHFVKNCHPQTGGYPDVRFTHVFGFDPQGTQEVVKAGDIPHVVSDPAEMLGAVDGVVVVFRHGDLHLPYALPFIEKGIPTWIDKPFTIKPEDARTMLDAAKKNHTLITGGSSCKYAPAVLELKAALPEAGKISSAMLNFPIFLDSPYGGFHFYAAHLIEMVTALFGFEIQSLLSVPKGLNLLAVARYRDFDVLLNYTEAYCQFHGIVIGEDKSIVKEIDVSTINNKGLYNFVNMIRSGKAPFDPEELYKVTVITNAIEQGMNSGTEVKIIY